MSQGFPANLPRAVCRFCLLFWRTPISFSAKISDGTFLLVVIFFGEILFSIVFVSEFCLAGGNKT